jgi:hypothetical protein
MGQTSIGLTPLHSGVIVDIYDDGTIPIHFGKGHKLFMISDAELNSPHARDGHTKHAGIRPRWAIVTGLSDEALEQTGLKLGDKVLCDTNKWTPGFRYEPGNPRKAWWIKHTDIILVDEDGVTDAEREHIDSRPK